LLVGQRDRKLSQPDELCKPGNGYPQALNAGIVTKGYFYGEELDLDEGAPGSDLRFEVRSAAGAAYNANSTVSANTSLGWHHLVGVCDEAGGMVWLYVDGVAAGSAAIPSLSGITNSAAAPMTIGARAQNAASGNNEQFIGRINDVAVFNYALNSSQVQTLYQSGVSLPPAGLTLTNFGGNSAVLNWNYGVLQSAASVAGPYSDLTNAVQPYQIPATNGQQFFRIREN
jgi:hypothetical protein